MLSERCPSRAYVPDEAAELGTNYSLAGERHFYPQGNDITADEEDRSARGCFAWLSGRCGQGVTVNPSSGPTHSPAWKTLWRKLGGGQSFEAFEKEFFPELLRPSSLIKRLWSLTKSPGLRPLCSPLPLVA